MKMNPGKVVLAADEIQRRIEELAAEISNDYREENPVLISLLKGAFIFFADLVRNLTIPHEIDFITASSYSKGTEREKNVRIINDLKRDIDGRNIIIVEGIVDTGHTVRHLIDLLSSRNAKSIRVCSLLDKPSSREVEVNVDYIGFTIPDIFVVGYGLDFREMFRNLNYIAELSFEGKRSERVIHQRENYRTKGSKISQAGGSRGIEKEKGPIHT
ncbi:MAG: hypoxanthine phosphoribosyltransferase [Candidatus Latescibacteria bacterium 4484_7]|nr:MAG: hypoxanthine phosphoribosyltransferase [Candidatus Latescibacteria bacterium 4484_7]